MPAQVQARVVPEAAFNRQELMQAMMAAGVTPEIAPGALTPIAQILGPRSVVANVDPSSDGGVVI